MLASLEYSVNQLHFCVFDDSVLGYENITLARLAALARFSVTDVIHPALIHHAAR